MEDVVGVVCCSEDGLEENLADLREHIRDAEAGHALGYTVFDREGTVQGSVYFYGAHLYLAGELTPKSPITRPERFLAVDYWLRSALERDAATTGAFIGALQRFLDETVPDAEPVWLLPEGPGVRRDVCEARKLAVW